MSPPPGDKNLRARLGLGPELRFCPPFPKRVALQLRSSVKFQANMPLRTTRVLYVKIRKRLETHKAPLMLHGGAARS